MRPGPGKMLVTVALLLAGCSCNPPPELPGMVIKAGNGAEVQDLDPQQVTGVAEHRVLCSLFEGLAGVDPATLDPVPGAAASWDVSPDGLTYTFHLRSGGKWSDGAPLTAEDFAWSWRRMLSPRLAAEYAYLLHCIRGAQAYNAGDTDDFSTVGVRAADPLTLVVTLEHPTPYFLSMQSHCAWYPVQRHVVKEFGGMDERATAWSRPGRLVGNGPFLLRDWQPNELIQVVRNPHYWDAAAVKPDAVAFYPIDNLQTEERTFRAGNLHLTATVPMHRIPVYRREHPDQLRIHPYLGVYFYRVNVTKPPFTDRRVRRALALALDRGEIAAHVMKSGELPAGSLVPPDTAGYTSRARVDFDPAAARALLAEAGFPGGEGMPPVDILYNTSEAHKTIAEAVQRMWREHLGVDARLLNQDWKVYLSSMNTLDYTVARSSWVGDVVDPVNFLECFLTGGGNNRCGWSSPEYDRLIRDSYAEVDPARRLELLQQAEEILLGEAPVIPVYYYTWTFLMAPEARGFQPNMLGLFRWQDLWLEPGGAQK